MKIQNFIKILDCKKIHHKENKIYEINKYLAEKYDESVKQKRNFKKMKRVKPINKGTISSLKENKEINERDREKKGKYNKYSI